ncbi:hypothetical protein Pyn_00996 [Prunus yedoensis var. nudiflora]|uniref:Uncharacterized protein n=1 Tax=Prunus yedoensis var. nudiflora TaxID=2094558 RepID=A0A314UIB7_PRUYE|nr:hypothetical protein Pyn_00996 [Prunus yedoensis var. nudiflora]
MDHGKPPGTLPETQIDGPDPPNSTEISDHVFGQSSSPFASRNRVSYQRRREWRKTLTRPEAERRGPGSQRRPSQSHRRNFRRKRLSPRRNSRLEAS